MSIGFVIINIRPETDLISLFILLLLFWATVFQKA